MTVAATANSRVQYAGVGTTGPFPVPFRFMATTHLSIVKTSAAGIDTMLTLGTDYSASGADVVSGGVVVTTAPVAIGEKLTIVLDIPIEQLTDYVPNDPFPAETHERALDKITLILQQLRERIGRSLQFPISESVSGVLARIATRANTLLGFGPDGSLNLFDPKQFKGDPGGNAMAIGLFNVANTLAIPLGTDVVQTTGHTVRGKGPALYVYDPLVDAAFVAAWPRAAFRSTNGRGFRIVGASLSPDQFGAVVDGATNDSAAIQAAYDYLHRNNTFGGTLQFEQGIYVGHLTMYSRIVNVAGRGRAASTLRSATAAADTINIVYREGSWRFVTISDLRIQGAGGVGRNGVGVGVGSEVFQVNDQYSCCTNIERCTFDNHEKSIARRYGQIGLYCTNVNFEQADFHIWTKGFDGSGLGAGGIMHGGCLFVKHCHLNAANKAVFYMDSPIVGTGQMIVEDCIMEANAGFLLFCKAFSDNDFTPAIHFSRCWNEINYQAASVNIDGVNYTPGHAYINNTMRVVFHDMPMGPVTFLGQGTLLIDYCDVKEMTLTKSADATIVLRDAYAFESNHNFPFAVDSFQMQGKGPPSSGAALWWPMKPLTAKTREHAGRVIMSNDASAPITFSGSTTRPTVPAAAGDGAPSPTGNCQELTINAGETLLPQTQGAFVGGRYYVAKYLTRLKSGLGPGMQITGATGDGGYVELNDGNWRVLVSAWKASASGTNSMYHFGKPGGGGVICIGGYSITEFGDRQSAMDYANSPLFALP